MKTFLVRYKLYLLEIGLAIVIVAALGIWLNLRPAAVSYPTQSWQSSTPEEQGFDSAKLAEGLLSIQQHGIKIHSLILIRHGKVFLNATFYPYDATIYHDVASITKSLTATLIGIAADQGKLSLDQPMVSFFPDRTIAHRDERKDSITVRHLVTMSSGLNCGVENEATSALMQASPDWVQFALDRPVTREPGTRFEYCNLGMHLLSAILQKATGMTALEFARINLFEPLGIRNAYWVTDPQGYNRGWGDAALYPEDMARLGYLFLHKGRWEGRQVISEEWINLATTLQMQTGPDYGEDYGFGWWVSKSDEDVALYGADGRAGQRITVIPEWDLVAVTTGGGFSSSQTDPYLLAAIGDLKNPLPANPSGVEQLNAALALVAQPREAATTVSLPETAAAISGQTFVFEANPLQVRSMRIDFTSPDAATFYLEMAGDSEPQIIGVGLDGLYRASIQGRPTIARGSWKDDNTFYMDYSEGPGLADYNLQLRFADGQLFFEIDHPAMKGQAFAGAPLK